MNDTKSKLCELSHNLQAHERAVYLAADGSPEQSKALAAVHTVASEIAELTKSGEPHNPEDDWPDM